MKVERNDDVQFFLKSLEQTIFAKKFEQIWRNNRIQKPQKYSASEQYVYAE